MSDGRDRFDYGRPSERPTANWGPDQNYGPLGRGEGPTSDATRPGGSWGPPPDATRQGGPLPPPEATGMGATGRPPVIWLAAALGLAVVAVVAAVLGGGALMPSAAAWVAAGPLAIGLFAVYVRRDSRQRSLPVYTELVGATALCWATGIAAAVGIGLSAWYLALWAGHL